MIYKLSIALATGFMLMADAQAVSFEINDISGAFDSTITIGAGFRTRSPDCGLIVQGAIGSDAPSGCLGTNSGMGDQGNMNYKVGQPFTTYIKGTHELLLDIPQNWKFMARATWAQDFSSTTTANAISTGNQGAGITTPLPSDARSELETQARLLDLWVSKSFALGEEQARVRLGNQVINWGESIFIPGGINQTNAMDVMRLQQPGTLLKEVLLPAPILSFATGLGHGMNVEAYVQGGWNSNYLPPTGSYWSTSNGLSTGSKAYGITTIEPKHADQYGLSLHWQPSGGNINLGTYFMQYQDKSPQVSFTPDSAVAIGARQNWIYAEDRQLFGVSANFQAGNWAFGSELSYRPRDAISLNGVDCLLANSTLLGATSSTPCHTDAEKYQLHLTGILNMVSDDYGTFLNALGGADSAALTVEAVAISYPGLKSSYNGLSTAAGGWSWGYETDSSVPPATTSTAIGTPNSWGFNFDFSWNYDGTLIDGWRVTPSLYYFRAMSGRTPNATATFMEGAQSATFSLTLTKNPSKWVGGISYSRFWGGNSPYDQPLGDRDNIGLYLSRAF